MAGEEIASGADAIVMNEKDHVATALRDLAKGEQVQFLVGAELRCVAVQENIDFGHKIALTPIAAGVKVLKYGEVIGLSTTSIEAGSHVHVHNLEGIRGRGDQAETGVRA
ncbi:UxaA family hydrolase [Paenibacillus sp. HB172176]|uniref:UxaA family hydrolase n=1 Tax=Paenibacillus sp. HB172176 TaxID=2493690 RepID=UPI001F0D4583|nr:UxaA family hydrolase [Paenibacillus sp. HB172176]